jgi:hypothetical protein
MQLNFGLKNKKTMKNQIIPKKILRISLLALTIFTFACIALVYFSPYKAYAGSYPKMVRNSVVINQPADSVFNFVSNNAYTQAWLSYVDHIKTFSKCSNQKGVRNSYYFNPDELGQKFDGILLDVNKNRMRKLLFTNFNDFPFEPGNIIQEQFYRPLKGNKCELCFTVHYEKENITMLDEFKACIAAYRVERALRENMENIKAVIEEGKMRKI